MLRVARVVVVAMCLGALWVLARAEVSTALAGLVVVVVMVPVAWLSLGVALRGRGALPALLGPPVVAVASLAVMKLEPTALGQHDVAEAAVFAAVFVILAAAWAIAVPLEGRRSPPADRSQ